MCINIFLPFIFENLHSADSMCSNTCSSLWMVAVCSQNMEKHYNQLRNWFGGGGTCKHFYFLISKTVLNVGKLCSFETNKN